MNMTWRALATAGFNSAQFTGHSYPGLGQLRRQLQKVVEDSLIKRLGHWESAAYMLYVRTPLEVLVWQQDGAGKEMQGRLSDSRHNLFMGSDVIGVIKKEYTESGVANSRIV